ncbi:MAG TPA: hypothetical protein VFQ15_03560 [Jiangellaceae bacterium]|nr:hypothetical protein [Jiangellaceae bacterium]
MTVAADRQLLGISFIATATVGGVYTGEAWLPTTADGAGGAGAGTRLAFKVSAVTPTPSIRNVILFDAPVAVTAGQLVRLVLNNSEGRYVYTQGFFNAAGLTNGVLSAYQTGATIGGLGVMRNGTSRINTAPNAYPSNTFDGSCYFVDGVFGELSTVTLAPIVLPLAPEPVTPVPGVVSVALTPVVAALTAPAVTPVPGLVTVALTPVVAALAPVPVSILGVVEEPGNPLTASGTAAATLTTSGSTPTLTASGRP